MNVGDLKTRISDGKVVEVVSVDDEANTVCVVPYHVMHGHRRFSDDAVMHQHRQVACPMSDFRDVADGDLTPVREAFMNESSQRS